MPWIEPILHSMRRVRPPSPVTTV